MPIKIGLASHRFGNIGHWLMATGMEEAVRHTFGKETEIVHFEQHHFFSAYSRWHPLRFTHLIPHGRIRWLRNFLNSSGACNFFWPQTPRHDLAAVIECGGPSMVHKVGITPEMGLIFHHQAGCFSQQGIPVLDLAVGSCFPLERVPDEITDPSDVAYYKRIFSLTAHTSARDPVAFKLFTKLGREPSLICCGALLCGYDWERRGFIKPPEERTRILINYQRLGANEDWNQGVDGQFWRTQISTLYKNLSQRHSVAFLCHNQKEKTLADNLNLGVETIMPKSSDEYAQAIATAKAAIVSRIHAAIPLASIGVPSVCIGTDTRLGTLKQIGLKAHFVKGLTAETVEHDLEFEISNLSSRRDELLEKRRTTREEYKALLLKYSRLK